MQLAADTVERDLADAYQNLGVTTRVAAIRYGPAALAKTDAAD